MSLVSVSEVRDYLSINNETSNAKLSMLANMASSVIQSYCGREFSSSYVVEFHDGGFSSINVNRPPINNVNSVSQFNGSSYEDLQGPNLTVACLNASSNADYVWDTSGLITVDTQGVRNLSVRSVPTFSNYAKGVRVEYNGGYDDVPDDLKLATLEYIKLLNKQDLGVMSKTAFGQSSTKNPLSSNLPAHIRGMLDHYVI